MISIQLTATPPLLEWIDEYISLYVKNYKISLKADGLS